MALEKRKEALYTAILHQELKVAMGCTEPIAIAYCAAYARKVLGAQPVRYVAHCSGNIIKNAKAVTVPQTGGLKGIEAAVLAGSIGGDPSLELEVLTTVTPEHQEEIRRQLAANAVELALLDTPHSLHIVVECYAQDGSSASAEIVDTHTNIGQVKKNGEVIRQRREATAQETSSGREELNVRDILIYADTVDLDDVRDVLERQIELNMEISREGLTNTWGTSVGKTLLEQCADDRCRLRAIAAAGSDARMNGCALPVVINSGSGNQGMTVSIPVIEYARMIGAEHDKLLRALCVSNLCAIHQKTGIGRLSAYCGAVSAATGSAAGIAYLDGQDYNCIAQTIINSLGNISGMICDGAKSSCAAKIASALESALLGYDMAKAGRGFQDGEGIVKGDVEETIKNVGRMASKGMHCTDLEVLRIMIDQ
ncbi:MAG: serine dehydratase subunit alpha family protein [Oscillospiraceae bacterium]